MQGSQLIHLGQKHKSSNESFLTGSLFGSENPLEVPQNTADTYSTNQNSGNSFASTANQNWDSNPSNLNKETYLSVYTEANITRRFPAFWCDYLYTMEIVKEGIQIDKSK